MRRINLHITDNQFDTISKMASDQGRPFAEALRNVIDLGLATDTMEERARSLADTHGVSLNTAKNILASNL